jgi:tRNA (guanine-N7-)-methyltransferase
LISAIAGGNQRAMHEDDRNAAPRARIRGMRAEDGAALVALHRRAIHAVPDTITPPEDRESWAHGLCPEAYARIAGEGRETFLVAEIEGHVAGFVSFALDGARGEIAGLYVDPAWQGRGIGRRLAGRAEAILRGRGAERVCVRSSLPGAPAYRAFGYRETGRGKHRSRGGRDLPMLFMEKALGGEWRNFYGRRHGKTLRAAQERALSDLERFAPRPVARAEDPGVRRLDLARFAGRPIWLEIGFGGGEHLLHQATANPGVQIIGAEPFVNGVATLLSRLREGDPGNVSIHAGDVRDLIEVLPDACLARVFLLYPDPWPKRRHHRRRFVTEAHLVPLARIMAPGAELRIATDIPDYVAQARREVPRCGFRDATADARRPWRDWYRTRYEAKALREGRRPFYLTYARA